MTLQTTKEETLIISVAQQINNGDKLLLGIGLPITAGAIAKMFLAEQGITSQAYVSQVGDIKLSKSIATEEIANAEQNIVRCPDQSTADEMIKLIEEVKKAGNR